MGKFKVWDDKLKSFLSGEFYFLDSNGKLHYLYSATDTHYTIYTNECHDWIIPVFSTGRTDETGVKIYEGDIVKNTNPDSEAYRETSIVEYHTGIGGFTVIFEAIGQNKMVGIYEFLEVIGNKFENPELMEST